MSFVFLVEMCQYKFELHHHLRIPVGSAIMLCLISESFSRSPRPHSFQSDRRSSWPTRRTWTSLSGRHSVCQHLDVHQVHSLFFCDNTLKVNSARYPVKKYRVFVMRPLIEDTNKLWTLKGQSRHTRPSRSITLKTEKRLQIKCFLSAKQLIVREASGAHESPKNMVVPPESLKLALNFLKSGRMRQSTFGSSNNTEYFLSGPLTSQTTPALDQSTHRSIAPSVRSVQDLSFPFAATSYVVVAAVSSCSRFSTLGS